MTAKFKGIRFLTMTMIAVTEIIQSKAEMKANMFSGEVSVLLVLEADVVGFIIFSLIYKSI